jgi:y4mF family transcriptional regulator
MHDRAHKDDMTYEQHRPAGADPRVSGLSQAVRARREELGLRQAELADLAGCSQRFVHTVEHGKASLRLDKVLDVLEVLGLGLAVVPGRGEITSDSERGSAASPGAAE